MKVAIVGSRDFENLKAVRGFVRSLRPGTIVLTGGAAGVDLAAETAAREEGLELEIIRPDYRKHHPKLAPKIRNREIAEKCDAMIAFWDGMSGGTANAVTWAIYFGKVVTVLTNASVPDRIDPKDAAIDSEDQQAIDQEHEDFEAGGEGGAE
jgi:predicted Rossmann fold nucleotide-binding protein DprA/Smf involved in DNA uptake